MSIPMHRNRQHQNPTVGLLLIVGEIISSEQRDEICLCLQNAFQQIDGSKYYEINDLFNNLIHENEFQIDSQYRQIANTENGSTAGFLYHPSFYTLLNVLHDLFQTCCHVCVIFCGQQVDSNGALMLSDSLFTAENFSSLFQEDRDYVLENLQIVLPFVSNQWMKLANNYLKKHVEHVEIHDLTNEVVANNSFGHRLYERLVQVIRNDSNHFDIYSKLVSGNNSGTIAFDEPNLYVFYSQQGEASLFGIRGFVVLINSGFCRIPSYWNFIRGLQTIDACILTHFDYDVFPGLQTIVHRKQIFSSHDAQSGKPDVGAIFLNHIQRSKLQSKSSPSSKLLMNLTNNIDQFMNATKQLNIDTFNLIKPMIANKSNFEPINLYRKIAFGSLDMYVLHPTSSPSEDERLISSLQKIPIRNQQVSPSVIPHHHWYSSCLLLVWTPTAKSNKDSLVRILITGACPQTLVFEALDRVRHLDFLHASQQQQPRRSISHSKLISSTHVSSGIKHPLQKPRIPSSMMNRTAPAVVQNKPQKPSPRVTPSKLKVSQTTTTNAKKSSAVPSVKKTPAPPKTNEPTRSISKEKKPIKPHETTSKASNLAKQTKSHPSKVKPLSHQKQKAKTEEKSQKKSDSVPVQERKSETEHDVPRSILAVQNENREQTLHIINEHSQDLETEVEHEHVLESQNNDYDQQFDDHGEQHSSNDNDDQQYPVDDFTENTNTEAINTEDDIQRSDSISSTMDQNETLVESKSESPMNEEATSQISPQDPMTTSFMDGVSDTENPFNGKITDDEMEIVHHDTSSSPRHSLLSTDDIEPQGLPIETNYSSKQSTSRKINNGTKHTNGLSRSGHQSQPTLSGSIFNVDVAYIPYHGNEHYVDSEFFRRIRARYYILNAVQISPQTLDSLLAGVHQWKKKEHELITLVPTFDSEQLRQFFIVNKNRLAELNINILPASSRCNVQYDNESSPAQLIRFGSFPDTYEQ
ncbi:unnamed protein product [Adineta ricciae]|uniref:Microtubule-associated protein 1A/B/S-like MBL-like domain-containing protein n=1 Tax=Adineta ricciae TaxID=249248 RepID=A0A814CZG4_ADIRI|nr:unnamed protein product [Adineta ricciae]CAF0950140.1 unnamed protein product [Adineta ricciae]